jgi:hypothetical protein
MLADPKPKEVLSAPEEGAQTPAELPTCACLAEHLKEAPLTPFIDGYYCDKCGVGFIPAEFLQPWAQEVCDDLYRKVTICPSNLRT